MWGDMNHRLTLKRVGDLLYKSVEHPVGARAQVEVSGHRLDDPVSQDQTMTILFFQHHCVVLKFQDQRMTK